MSPPARTVFIPSILAVVCGCNWVVDFRVFQNCGPQRPLDQRTEWEERVKLPASTPFATPEFMATEGCVLAIDVYRESSLFAEDPANPSPPEPLRDVPYEVRIEPLQPEGRVDRGVLGGDGRIIVETVQRNETVTITLFLPSPREEDGIQEESAVIYLNAPYP